MGYTLNAQGKPTFNNDATNPGPAGDFQKAADWAEMIGGLLKGTKAEREALTSAQSSVGWMFTESDTGAVYIRNASGWDLVWAPDSTPGNLTLTAGGNFTLSNNNLFIRSGNRLVGTVDWDRAGTTTVVHGDVFLTLPTEVRPQFDAVAHTTGEPTQSSLFPLVVQTDGQVKTLSPPAGRTNGTIRFDMWF